MANTNTALESVTVTSIKTGVLYDSPRFEVLKNDYVVAGQKGVLIKLGFSVNAIRLEKEVALQWAKYLTEIASVL